MVLPISGFMPVPLAMMIPFMFMQSIMMGYGFGTGFQYSKRKISAMSNEEFNKTTIKNETSKMFEAYQAIIPDIQQSIRDSKDLQVTIVEEMVKIPAHLLNALLGGSTAGSSTEESPAGSQPTSPTSETFPKTAADVFRETPDEEKVDPFDPNRVGIPRDSSVPVADWSKHNVHRYIYVNVDILGASFAQIQDTIRRWFYASFSDPRHLIMQKSDVIHKVTRTVNGLAVGVRVYVRIVFYID